MAEQFERHARTNTSLTLVSRVTGLVRDASLASVFGISPYTDAFNFAFQIPNLFRRLFGEGAISAAFVPRYTEMHRDDPERARRFAGLMMGLLAILLWCIVLVGEVLILWAWSHAPEVEVGVGPAISIAGVPLPTVSVRYARLAYELTAIMLPYMPMVCLVAVGGSALQTHGRFGPTAGSPIILNIFMIAAMLGLYPLVVSGSISPATHLRVLSAAILLAGAVQLAWTHVALRKVRPVFAPRDAVAWAAVRATLLGTAPMMIGLGVTQINILMDGVIASWPSIFGPTILGFDYPLAEGALTTLNNASRLYEFPLGVFGISIATAIFPLLSRLNNDLPAFTATVRRGMRLSLFIGLPASLGLVLVAREAVGVLFQRGAFDAEDTVRVARVVVGFAPAIWAYQLIHIYSRAFFALKQPMTPMKVSVSMVALNFSLNIALIFTPLREAGLAWSTSICSTIQCLWLLRKLSREVPGIVDREFTRSALRSLAAVAAMGVAVSLAAPFLPDGFSTRAMATTLAAKVALGAGVFIAVALVFGMEELQWAVGDRLAGILRRLRG